MSQDRKKILAIKLGALGDIFLMLGAIKDLAYYAGGAIDVLTTAPYAKIFRRSPDVANVLIDSRSSRLNIRYLAGLRRILNNSEFDLIVDLQNANRTTFYRRWLAPQISWCQSGTVSQDLFSSNDTNSRVLAKLQHQLTEYGISTDNLISGDLSWLCEESEASNRLERISNPVVLLPGASARHSHKIWPHYDQLARNLIDQGIRPFIVPGPDDMELCKSISGELLLNDGKWLDFFQLAGVLDKASFVIGNDSGPTHLAASLGCFGLAFFDHNTSKYANNMQRRNMQTRIENSLSEISVREVSEILMKALIDQKSG